MPVAVEGEKPVLGFPGVGVEVAGNVQKQVFDLLYCLLVAIVDPYLEGGVEGEERFAEHLAMRAAGKQQ